MLHWSLWLQSKTTQTLDLYIEPYFRMQKKKKLCHISGHSLFERLLRACFQNLLGPEIPEPPQSLLSTSPGNRSPISFPRQSGKFLLGIPGLRMAVSAMCMPFLHPTLLPGL